MEEELKTYQPKIRPQKPLDFKADAEGFEVGSDNLIHTKLNQAVIIQRISRDLYNNPSSGLRELYMNSVRACQLAEEKHGRKGQIKVTLVGDTDKRLIKIEDNGIGISKERFNKVLVELGTSDNLDGETTGQFGMGFAAYMTMSSVCIIDTLTDAGEGYRMLAKDGSSFQPIGKSERSTPGTTIEMTPYQSVDLEDLVDYSRLLVRYSPVQTAFTIRDVTRYENDEAKEFEQKTYLGAAKTDMDGTFDIIRFDTPDYEFVARIGYISPDGNSGHVFLCNVPITSNIEMPFRWWTLNIKNERKFMPMPDRDRMTEDADNAIQELVHEKVQEHFKAVIRGISTYDDMIKSEYRQTFVKLIYENDEDITAERFQMFADLQQCYYQKIKIKDVYEDRPMASLCRFLATEDSIVMQTGNHAGTAMRVRKVVPDAYCIFPKRKRNTDWEAVSGALEEFGIPFSRDVARKAPTKSAGAKTILLHAHKPGKSYGTETVFYKEVNSRVIRVDAGKLQEILHILKRVPTIYKIVRNEPTLPECGLMSKFLKRAGNLKLETNQGPMKIRDIPMDKEIKFVGMDKRNKEFLFDERFQDEVVVAGIAGAFELFLYWFHNGCYTKQRKLITESIISLDDFMASRFGHHLYAKETIQYFLDHYGELKPCHWHIFSSMLNKYNRDGEEAWDRAWAQIKAMPTWEKDDWLTEYETLRNFKVEGIMADSLESAIRSRLNSMESSIRRSELKQTKLLKEKMLAQFDVQFSKVEAQPCGADCVRCVLELTSTDFSLGKENAMGFTVTFSSISLHGKTMTCEVCF